MPTATKSNSNTTKETPWTAKAASTAHDTVDQVAERAARAEGSLRDTAEHSSAALAEKNEALQESVKTNYSKARSLAAENPLATAGIAFAAGIVLTSLFRGRR